MSHIRSRRIVLSIGLLALGVVGCTPGYIKAEDLNSKEQGPTHCASRCHELGMEMGALVLVGDQLPGCVCQPRGTAQVASRDGATGAATGYGVVLAAAAAARHEQLRQQQLQQQQRSRH